MKHGGMLLCTGVLVANKIDLDERRVISTAAGEELAQSKGLAYFECSAVSIACCLLYQLLIAIIKLTQKTFIQYSQTALRLVNNQNRGFLTRLSLSPGMLEVVKISAKGSNNVRLVKLLDSVSILRGEAFFYYQITKQKYGTVEPFFSSAG